MKIEDLVEKYIDAWNRCDLDALLSCMHKGAAYYDAFWMESCVGNDLTQYFLDAFDEEPFWFERTGDVITTENGAVISYATHQRSDSSRGAPIYHGAEVLTLRDGLILTSSDYYCNPDPEILVEIASLAAKRHGLPSHVKSGLSALRAMRLRDRLSTFVDRDNAPSPSDLTLSQLADQIGCTTDQLLNLIDAEYGTGIGTVSGRSDRVYVRDVLPKITVQDS